MNLQEIISQEKRNQKNIETDADGVNRLWINDQHLIHLRQSSDEKLFYMYAKIASLPPEPIQAKIYFQLLEANLLGNETGRAFLAIQSKSEAIVLMQTFEASIVSYESYQEDFQYFIDYLTYWKKKIIELYSATPSKNTEDALKLMSHGDQKIIFA